MDIVIIGAGIGGLTTAIFLEEMGFNVQIFEQAQAIKPIGAGIILAHNAMQVYNKIGLKAAITDRGNTLSSINIKTADFKNISTIKTDYFDDKYTTNSVAIQRGCLQQLLVKQLKTTIIHLNKRVVDIQQRDRPLIRFADSNEINCDLVIAADGINSVVREKLFNESTIRKTNQVCWRGISHMSLTPEIKDELNELWGKGSRFGFVQLSENELLKNEVYWYALHNNNESVDKNNLVNYFKYYAPVVGEIIANTPIDKIFNNAISDLKPMPSWAKGNVCLLGDAAHATTPNMGQGACQAIEDAYVLSHYLNKYLNKDFNNTKAPNNSLNNALMQYQNVRKNKADMIVNMSRQLGHISHIKNPILSAVRNLLMGSVPSKLNRSTSDKIYSLAEL